MLINMPVLSNTVHIATMLLDTHENVCPELLLGTLHLPLSTWHLLTWPCLLPQVWLVRGGHLTHIRPIRVLSWYSPNWNNSIGLSLVAEIEGWKL